MAALTTLCRCLTAIERRDGRRCQHDSWSLARTAPGEHSWASPHEQAPVPVVLLAAAIGAVLFLAVLLTGQQAMCAMHDQGLRYCPGYQQPAQQEQRR